MSAYQSEMAMVAEQYRKERDEARAKYEDLYVMAYGKDKRDTWVAEAEAQGFERGVREAAKVATGFPYGVRDKDGQPAVATAILALLEPVTLQKPEA
jgi:hypothetical protein